MKKYGLLLVLFLLSGCGGKDTTTTATTGVQPPEANAEEQNIEFSIQNQKWSFVLPPGWEIVENPDRSTGAIILARNGTASFVVLQKLGANTISKQDFFDQAQKDFDAYKLIEEGDLSWTFEGKLKETDPMRVFTQQVDKIKGTNKYLYISCGYEKSINMKAECEKIYKTWSKTVIEETKEV